MRSSFPVPVTAGHPQQRLLPAASPGGIRGFLTRFCGLLPLLAFCFLVSSLNATVVSGTVYLVQGQSKQPASGVRMLACSKDGDVLRYTETDSAGHYTFAELPSTTILISAMKPGYVSRSQISHSAWLQVNAGNAKLTDQDFDLFAGGVITGHVNDSEGEPLEGVHIELHAVGSSGATGSPATSVMSDDTGAYRLFGLAPGRYSLVGKRSAQDELAQCAACSVQRWAGLITVDAGSEISGIDLRFAAEPISHASSGTASTEQARGSISGVVSSAQTHEGVKGATVRLTSSRQNKLLTISSRTLSGGFFTFDHLEAGSYGLSAEKTGYEPKALTPQVHLTENQSRTGVDIKLNRAPTISGHISGLDDSPAVGADVALYRLLWRNARRVAVRSATATTDDRGMYRIAKLPVGDYILAASPPTLPKLTPKGDADFGTGRIFYPSAHLPSEAQTLRLSYGQEINEINVSLRAQETFAISGQVRDGQTGGPCMGCRIRVLNLDESYGLVQAQAEVASNGSYHVRGLAPGGYRVLVETNPNGRRLISSQVVQITDHNLEGIDLQAGVPHAISGSVVLESPPPDSRERKVAMHVRFTITDGIGPTESVAVEDDGTFAIANLSNEPYQLQIEDVPEGGYLRTVRSAGRDLPAPIISADQPLPNLELVVSFKSASLAGQVKLSNAAAAKDTPVTAVVVLVPRENESPYLTTVHAATHPDGGFKMTGVPPGSYTAYAFSRDSKLDWEDPEVLQRLRDYGKTLALDADKGEVVELTIVPDDQD
jgi:hypothetical protein